MAFPRMRLERACGHLASAVADAPAWGAVLLLLLAPLPMSGDLLQGAGAALSGGIAALGTAILARRMAGAPDTAPCAERTNPRTGSHPDGAAASQAPRVFTWRRFAAFLVALTLLEGALACVPMESTSRATAWFVPTDETFSLLLLTAAACGAFPRVAVVLPAVAAYVWYDAIGREFIRALVIEDRQRHDGAVLLHRRSADFSSYFRTGAWLEASCVRLGGALALLAAALPVSRALVVAAIGIATGFILSDAESHVHKWSLAASALALVVPSLVLATVSRRLAGELPASDGTTQVAIRAHPWIVSLGLLAWSWEVTGAIQTTQWRDPRLHEPVALTILSVALASALGTRRPGDLFGRFPGVLALQPAVFRAYSWLMPMSSRTVRALLPATGVFSMSCALAWAPFRPATRPVAAAAGLAAHFVVALAVATDGRVDAAWWALLVALPVAVLFTPWDARVALCGVPVVWAIASGFGWDGQARFVAGFAVAGVLVGAVCHFANRLRAMTPIPRDHPVFTEAPYVVAARSAGV